MRFPSSEQRETNIFSADTEPTDGLLNTPDKKELEKKKEAEEKENKELQEEKEQKDKKVDEEKKQKEAKKAEKAKKPDEEKLEAKKTKRRQLLERSLHYKKLYEEIPIPRDPWVIARLMVADHLLALHARIEQPPADTNPTDEVDLLASFDYMGIIADKLENPETESSPEIEETCETIVQLAQETLQEDQQDAVENLIVVNAESAKQPSVEALREKNEDHATPQDTPSDLSPSGAALIAILLHTRQSAPQPISPPQDKEPAIHQFTGGGDSSPIVDPEKPDIKPHVSPTEHSRDTLAPPSPRLETPAKIERSAPESDNPTRTYIRSSEALAGLAVTTALLNNSEPKQSPPTTKQHIAAPPPHFEKPISHTPEEKPAPTPTPSQPPSLRPQSILHETRPTSEAHTFSHRVEHTPVNTPSLSSREIEHLPIESLLKAAETISIGHGQRLRSAYEKGMIDKDGLVKVLKSHAKHHDFLQEYKQQVVRRHNLMQASPEFLTSSSKDDAIVSQNTDHSNVEDRISEAPAPQPRDIPSWPEFPNPIKNTPETDPFNLHEPPSLHAAWFSITKLGLLILGIAILVIMYLIFR